MITPAEAEKPAGLKLIAYQQVRGMWPGVWSWLGLSGGSAARVLIVFDGGSPEGLSQFVRGAPGAGSADRLPRRDR